MTRTRKPAKPRSFALPVPGGGVAMVHGDPKMSAKSRAALGEVLAAAAKWIETPEGKRTMRKMAERAKVERDEERSKPKVMRLPCLGPGEVPCNDEERSTCGVGCRTVGKPRLVRCYALSSVIDANGMRNLRPFLRATFTETYAALNDADSFGTREAWWPAYASLHLAIDDDARATLHESLDVGRTIEAALYAKAKRIGAPVIPGPARKGGR
jgi:hypothetical protein